MGSEKMDKYECPCGYIYDPADETQNKGYDSIICFDAETISLYHVFVF